MININKTEENNQVDSSENVSIMYTDYDVEEIIWNVLICLCPVLKVVCGFLVLFHIFLIKDVAQSQHGHMQRLDQKNCSVIL